MSNIKYNQGDFIIALESSNRYIEVSATFFVSGKSSNICTLNYILTEFNISENEYENTYWKYTDDLYEKCNDLFKHDDKYLQIALYEDYLEDKWLN